jgi:hypothetical protein
VLQRREGFAHLLKLGQMEPDDVKDLVPEIIKDGKWKKPDKPALTPAQRLVKGWTDANNDVKEEFAAVLLRTQRLSRPR